VSAKSLNAYLAFDGKCVEAFGFYAECLGAELQEMHRYTGSPMEKEMPPDWGDKVMHASLSWNGFRLMGSDGPAPSGYAGISLCVNLDDAAQAESVFAALAKGGKITQPIAQTFWAKRFGMLTDRFGVSWMVNCE